MSENAFYAAFFFPSAAAVLVFFMKYISAILQARVRLGQDQAYRALAASTATTLGDIQAKLNNIEKILKDVG